MLSDREQYYLSVGGGLLWCGRMDSCVEILTEKTTQENIKMIIVTHPKSVYSDNIKYHVKISWVYNEVWWLALHKATLLDKIVELPYQKD